jgi:NAD(P)-dependent dehydrogenase (short-subunit alcohol dehydrogenase family)
LERIQEAGLATLVPRLYLVESNRSSEINCYHIIQRYSGGSEMVDAAKKLAGRVALVTGASRGVGKGVAIGLGEQGATVYVTARTLSSPGELPGTAEQTAREITDAGGKGIALQCDHADDSQVDEVVRRIERDAGGLDILVNNVYPAPGILPTAGPKMPGGAPFWQTPVDEGWAAAFTLGVRGHYVMTQKAMPLLLKRSGLVVNISSPGNYTYLVSTMYGMGKAANERMMVQMAMELEEYPVSIMTLWPGVVRTEFTGGAIEQDPEWLRQLLSMSWANIPGAVDELAQLPREKILELTETPVFSGRAVAALATDPNVKLKSGRVLSVVGLANEFGFTDVDGTVPDGLRLLDVDAWPPLAKR